MTTMPEELLFEPDGHVTDAVLACVADGELALVPAPALGHLDGCDHCTHRLGEAALLSVYASAAGDLLRAPAPAVSVPVPVRPSGIRARRPLPVAAIAAALVLVVLTASPSLVATVRAVPETIASAAATVPFLVHVAQAFVRAPWGAGTAALLMKCASALILMVVGLQVARGAPWGASRARSTMGDPWQQGGG